MLLPVAGLGLDGWHCHGFAVMEWNGGFADRHNAPNHCSDAISVPAPPLRMMQPPTPPGRSGKGTKERHGEA